MPKIIKHLEKKIIETSLELFENNSYHEVNMRTIAEKLGVAVGTLYNYFPTKWDLYKAVFEESWVRTYKKLQKKTEKSAENYISNFYKTLYYEMKNKKGIARELFRYVANNMEQKEEKRKAIKKIKFPEVVVNQIYELFLVNIKKEYELDTKENIEEIKKLFTMMYTSIPFMIKAYENEDKNNIQFINKMVKSYIDQHLLD